MTDKEIMKEANFKSFSYNTKYAEDSEFSDMLENPLRYRKEAILNIANILRQKAWRDGYEDGARESQPQWYYPSKGEYSDDCETVLGYAIKNKRRMFVEIYLRDGKWHLANRMLVLGYRIIAWQYLPEPPKEE